MPNLRPCLSAILAFGLTLVLGADAADARPAARSVADPVRLDHIRVQLLLERTGELSADIAPPADVTLWNTVIGEGSAGQPATDALVWVTLRSATAEANTPRAVTLTVRGRGGRVLARRVFDGVLISGGRAARALLVPEIGCAGPVSIEAAYGAQRLISRLDFACGE